MVCSHAHVLAPPLRRQPGGRKQRKRRVPPLWQLSSQMTSLSKSIMCLIVWPRSLHRTLKDTRSLSSLQYTRTSSVTRIGAQSPCRAHNPPLNPVDTDGKGWPLMPIVAAQSSEHPEGMLSLVWWTRQTYRQHIDLADSFVDRINVPAISPQVAFCNEDTLLRISSTTSPCQEADSLWPHIKGLLLCHSGILASGKPTARIEAPWSPSADPSPQIRYLEPPCRRA
jgi:hypothetical protein